MLMVVSPYHLTTREPAAMAALLLAHKVVTLLPAPFDNQHSALAAFTAAGRVPTYKALMKSWEWTVPLWHAGLLTSNLGGDTPAADMFDVGQKIACEDALTPLRLFAHDHFYEDERSYLGALAADLLKGGPDPGISVPLAAGLDRFAVRHGLTVARSAATSVAQRAESALSSRSIATIIPMLVQASAARIMHAREVLADVLEDMWQASSDSPFSEQDPSPFFQAYAQAFEQRREEILEDCRDDEVRLIEGAVSITHMTLPGDAVLRSSLTAVASMGKYRISSPAPSSSNLPALYDAIDQTPISAVIIKPLGISAKR